MSTVTIAPSPDPRWPQLRPITLRNPSPELLNDIISTYTLSGISYKLIYGDTSKAYKYPLAASFTSR